MSGMLYVLELNSREQALCAHGRVHHGCSLSVIRGKTYMYADTALRCHSGQVMCRLYERFQLECVLCKKNTLKQ